MSRSWRHTSITGNCKKSEKRDKQFSSRCFRRLTKELLRGENDDELPIKVDEVYKLKCLGAKDGKFHFDEDDYPELLRK